MIVENFLKSNKYALLTVLSEWLLPEEFMLFDSAITNADLRLVVLDLVLKYSIHFQSFMFRAKDIPLSIEMLRWTKKRGFSMVKFPKIRATNQLLQRMCVMPEEDLLLLTSFVFGAEQISIDRCSGSVTSKFSGILKGCENLKTLKVRNSQSIDPIVKVLINSCPILSKCDLSGCRNIAESTVIQLCRQCLLLQDLNVIDCHELTGHFIKCIVVNCPMLIHLKVNGCYRITRRDLFMLYMMFHGQLESIDCISALTDFHIRILSCYRGHTLKKLSVGASQYLHGTSISLLAVACYKLTELDISGCRSLTSADMARFAGYIKSLEKLRMKNVSIDDEGLLVLLENNPTLKELTLSNNLLTFESLNEIGGYCPSLTTLSINQVMLTEDHFISVIMKCKKLVNLCVDSNTLLTDNAFAAAAMCCRELKTITASCNNLTDLALFAFAQHCSHLTQLDINHCYQITDKGIAVLLEWCRHLIDLRITNCDQLTSRTLQKCTVFGKNLAILRTSIKVKKITVVLSMIDALRRLRYFSMYLLVDDLMTVTRHAQDANPDLRIAVYDE